MYFKLALQNVKKSFQDYLIYFLTLTFSVCLFYIFNSFQAQQAVLEMSSAQLNLVDSIQMMMMFLSIFVSIVLGFLIIYANNFLIKRRKKELGLYTLLGMPKHKISTILVYETFLVGVLSLCTGIIAGLFASQLLTVVTANLFEVKLNYSFIFSMDAMLLTIAAFSLIFFIIMVFNAFILNRYKLIDLLKADQKMERLKIKNIYISITLFLISLILLGGTYYYALSTGMEALFHLDIIAPLGTLGTFLFFLSLSGFLLKFVHSSKALYYRKLNMFVLRQINVSINSNFFSMSIVCLMLLFSIGALATGANLNKTINNSIALNTPYDYSHYGSQVLYTNNFFVDITNIKEDLNVDPDLIASDFFVHDYESDTKLAFFRPYLDENLISITQFEKGFEVLPLSEFNQLREDRDMEPITLTGNEAYIFTSMDILDGSLKSVIEGNPEFPLYGNQMHLANTDFEYLNLGTSLNTGTFSFGFVIRDELIPQDAPLYMTYWNVTLQDDVDQRLFAEQLNQKIADYNQTHPDTKQYNQMFSASAIEVRENSKGLSVIMTYIGIYLGLVFLLSSAVILALQQLSQASDNKVRYQILNKIGAEKTMLNHAILLQLSIYFLIPLGLAIIHSIVGIQVVNTIVKAFGSGDLFGASLLTGGIILLIYGSYFLVTYLGTKRILTR